MSIPMLIESALIRTRTNVGRSLMLGTQLYNSCPSLKKGSEDKLVGELLKSVFTYGLTRA